MIFELEWEKGNPSSFWIHIPYLETKQSGIIRMGKLKEVKNQTHQWIERKNPNQLTKENRYFRKAPNLQDFNFGNKSSA
jgi:hypothetical protein